MADMSLTSYNYEGERKAEFTYFFQKIVIAMELVILVGYKFFVVRRKGGPFQPAMGRFPLFVGRKLGCMGVYIHEV